MKKTFDAVAWMRQRRAQIDEEDHALTWEQKRQKTHEQVLQDPLLAPLCERPGVPRKRAPKATKTK